MKRVATALSIAVLCGIHGGCDTRQQAAPAATQPSSVASAAPTVGVIDVDRLGKAMGWNADATANYQAADAEVKHQIDSRMKMLQTEVESRKKVIVTEGNLTADQIAKVDAAKDKADLEKAGIPQKEIDKLMALGGAVMNERQQISNAYQQFMTQRQAAIRAAYREAMTPAVRRVAQASGRSVVVMQNDTILFSDGSADLTDKLIDDLQKSPPLKINLPEIPHPTADTSPTTMPASPSTTQP